MFRTPDAIRIYRPTSHDPYFRSPHKTPEMYAIKIKIDGHFAENEDCQYCQPRTALTVYVSQSIMSMTRARYKIPSTAYLAMTRSLCATKEAQHFRNYRQNNGPIDGILTRTRLRYQRVPNGGQPCRKFQVVLVVGLYLDEELVGRSDMCRVHHKHVSNAVRWNASFCTLGHTKKLM